jgi:broad specificity phosphatase PhoE
VVRHGQASFLEANYDKLSPLGETQSRRLGEYWAQRGVTFDRVFTGPRVRQEHTARCAAEAYRQFSLPFPDALVMPEFDEYDGENVLRLALPRLVEANPQARLLYQAFKSSSAQLDRLKTFQRLFEFVITKWVEAEFVVEGVESWPEFCARVNRGLSQLVSCCGHNTVAVFCSGGPIAVAVSRALHLSPVDTLRTTWMSRNASYSEFLFSGDRFTLSAFNAFPHLDESLLTYR